jgi:hypothetical protein
MKMQENTTPESLSVSDESDILTPPESSDDDATENGPHIHHLS